MCYRKHFVRLYTIMDCVSEIFRCFCFLVDFFLLCSILSLQSSPFFSSVYFLSDPKLFYTSQCKRRKWKVWDIQKERKSVREYKQERKCAGVIFYFSHDFLNEDNAIYTRILYSRFAICFMRAG